MTIKRIQCFEFQTLRVGEAGFTLAHFERLAAYQDRRRTPVFHVGHQRITFQNYVGALRVGGLTIEVLPKLDQDSGGKAQMQQLLLEMLRRAGSLKLEIQEKTKLKIRAGTLLDLHLRLFLQEVRELLHRGLPKRYVRQQKNEPCMRGRWLLTEHLKHNLVHQERCFVEVQQYDVDHRFNRILKRALEIVAEISHPALADSARQYRARLEPVRDQIIVAADFNRLHYNRETECYRSAMQLAELIITGFQPDLRSGAMPVMAMLFDMNQLFERYVANALQRAAAAKGVAVQTQCRHPFWLPHAGGGKTIRPDLRLTVDGRTCILDTKWKRLDKNGVTDADLKQLYVYSLQFEAAQVWLLYPATDETFRLQSGVFAESIRGNFTTQTAQLCTVPLFQSGKLHRRLGDELLERLTAELRLRPADQRACIQE